MVGQAAISPDIRSGRATRSPAKRRAVVGRQDVYGPHVSRGRRPEPNVAPGCRVSRAEVVQPPLADLPALCSDWSTGVDETEAFLLAQLAELDDLRETLAQREQELAAREEQLALDAQASQERWQKLEQLRGAAEQGLTQVQQEAQRLAQARAEVVALRTQLEQARTEAPKSGGKSNKTPNHTQIHQWEVERARLEQELQATHAQVAKLAVSTLELADARREAGELRRQLVKQQQRLVFAKGHFKPEQWQQLEVTHAALGRELDVTRQQLAELREQSQREQQQFTAERSVWIVELQKLRSAVEQVAAQRAAAPMNVAPVELPAANSLSGLLNEIEQMQAELNRDKPNKPTGQKTKR